MEAVLQARGRNAGVARAGRFSVGVDRVVADLAFPVFDRQYCDGRAVAVDADCDQTHQRCAAGDRTESGGAANARACRQMGRTACRAHRIGRARNTWLFVGIFRASRDMIPAHRRRSRGTSTLPVTTDLPDETASNVCYAYKASLIGAAHRFELTGDGLP